MVTIRGALACFSVAMLAALALSGCGATVNPAAGYQPASSGTSSPEGSTATPSSKATDAWWDDPANARDTLRLYQNPIVHTESDGTVSVFVVLTSNAAHMIGDAWVAKKKSDKSGPALICTPAKPLANGTEIQNGWECEAKFVDRNSSKHGYFAIIKSRLLHSPQSSGSDDAPLVRNAFDFQAQVAD